MQESYPGKSLLLVDDNDEDLELMMRAIKKLKLQCTVATAHDGEEALNYLQGSANGATQPITRPDLVLLDLNMPRVNGHDVLRQVQHDPALSLIPIVVLSTSNEIKDVTNSYALGANGYVVKPGDVRELFDSIRQITDFWFGRNITVQN